MSLVTRCPVCATSFKVVQDQLKISEGWVRCGRCSQVFDAMQDLVEREDLVERDDPAVGDTSAPVAPHSVNAAPSDRSEDTAADAAGASHRVPSMDVVAASATEGERADAAAGREAPDGTMTSSGTGTGTGTGTDTGTGTGTDSDSNLGARESELAPSPADALASGPERAAPQRVPQADAVSSAPEQTLGTTAARTPESADELAALFPQGPLEDQLSVQLRAQDAGEPRPVRMPRHAPFPDLDLNLPSPREVGLHSIRAPVQVAEDHDQAQLQKALRRARVKAAKAARVRARESGRAERSAAPAAVSDAPVVHSASETDAERIGSSWASSASASLLGALSRPMQLAFSSDHPRWWHMRQLAAHRPIWVVAGLLLALLLLLQVVHMERNLIAAREPAWVPALQQLCRLTGCTLSPLRRIAEIRIDGASFARERGGEQSFRLSFTLRSVSELPLAMPSIELTLLDTQERAVLRRVLQPREFGAPLVLPAHGERAATLPVTLDAAQLAGLPPVAGFLIEALYP